MTAEDPRRSAAILHPAALFGVFGFALILVQAVVRLLPRAWEPIAAGGLAWWHYALYAASIGFTFYAEGYRAFHKQVSPRVVARARSLADPAQRRFWPIAPLYCMGLVHAPRRRLIVAWCVYLGIVLLVLAVRRLAQPWRGMVDAGVGIALGFGLGSLLYFFGRALAGHAMPVTAELPDER